MINSCNKGIDMRTAKIINDNVKKIRETNTLLDMLLEFEGVPDNI